MPSGLTPWAEPTSFGPFRVVPARLLPSVSPAAPVAKTTTLARRESLAAKCEKDYPQHDVTEVMYRGYARRTLLDHYRLEYQWNGCSGQLLLNARRVP